MEFRDYLRIIRRHLGWFVLPIVLSVISYSFHLQSVPKYFESKMEVSLDVRDNRFNIVAQSNPFGGKEVLNRAAALALLDSEFFLESVRRKFHEAQPQLKNEQYSLAIGGKTSLKPIYLDEETTTFATISVRSTHPEVCKLLPQIVVEEFEKHAKEQTQKDLDNTARNIAEDREENLPNLAEVEQKLQDKRGDVSLFKLNEDMRAYNASLTQIKGRLLGLEAEDLQLKQDIERYKACQSKKEFPPELFRQEPLLSISRDIDNYEQEEKILLLRYTEDHFEVRRLREKLEHLRKVQDEKAKATLDERIFELESRLASNSANRDALNAEKAAAEKSAEDNGKKIEELQSLEDEVRRLREDLATFDNALGEIQRLRAKEHTYVTPLRQTEVATVIEQQGVKLMLFLLLGVVLGTMFAYIKDVTSTVFLTEHEVKKYMGLPVAFFVPKFSRGESPLISNWSNYSMPVEMFKSFAQMISRSYLARDQKILQITSPDKFDGKTTIATNIAIALSMTGKRVLLLDCDLKDPSIHRYLNLAKEGLGEYFQKCAKAGAVEDVKPYIQHTESNALDILAAGSFDQDTAALFDSPMFKAILDKLRASYDVVIVDTPPVGLTSDSIMCASYVDVVFFVLTIGNTDKMLAQKCKSLLEFSNLQISGLILNKAPAHTYSSRYYYYYGYNARR